MKRYIQKKMSGNIYSIIERDLDTGEVRTTFAAGKTKEERLSKALANKKWTPIGKSDVDFTKPFSMFDLIKVTKQPRKNPLMGLDFKYFDKPLKIYCVHDGANPAYISEEMCFGEDEHAFWEECNPGQCGHGKHMSFRTEKEAVAYRDEHNKIRAEQEAEYAKREV